MTLQIFIFSHFSANREAACIAQVAEKDEVSARKKLQQELPLNHAKYRLITVTPAWPRSNPGDFDLDEITESE